MNNESVRPGEGWISFAGIILFLAGFLNFVFGIAAIDNSTFFTDEGRYVIFDDLKAWGWFLIFVGILQVSAAISIWNRHLYGAIFGIASASMNILILLFTVNAYPFGRSCCSSSTCSLSMPWSCTAARTGRGAREVIPQAARRVQKRSALDEKR